MMFLQDLRLGYLIIAVAVSELMLSGVSFASAPESVAVPLANINRGDMKVGGSFSFLHSSSAVSSTTTLAMSPSAQYFIRDHLALGAALSLNHGFQEGGNTLLGVGPVASYYFLPQEKLIPFVQLQLDYNHTAAGPGRHDFDSVVNLGTDYFMTSSVAFGPAIRWTHVFGNDAAGNTSYATSNSFGLVGVFSMFL